MELSEEKREIIENHKGNTCIIAGAGSGKTRTLVTLIVNDILNGVLPEEIIAFTFTKKAADELLARVFSRVKEQNQNINLDGIFIGTIHAWSLKYLQENDDFINFNPLDEIHLSTLVIRLYDQLSLGTVYKGFFPKGIDEFLKDLEIYYNENLEESELPTDIKETILLFQRTLENNKLLTFGDMVRHAIRSLSVLGSLPKLKSLYVDEYQDVNPAQVLLIKRMINDNTKLTVVGDDLQCIYNWRGSDVTRILNFEKEFNNVRKFRLVTNYRSDPQIVNFSSKVADNIQLRDKEKQIQPGKKATGENHVHWLKSSNETEQASTTADLIEHYLQKGESPQSIAIILRSVLNSGQDIVTELEKRKIPVKCPLLGRGGAFVNKVLIPIFYWLGINQKQQRNEHEEQELSQFADNLWLNAKLYCSVDEHSFWEAVNEWIDLIEENKNEAYNIRSCLYSFYDKIGIRLNHNDTALMLSIGLSSQIIRSVEEIHRRRISGIERRTSRGIIKECHHALIHFENSFGESTPLISDFNGITITTVHQAKGLEWPIVIIPELNRFRFPLRERRHGTSFPDSVAARYGTTLDDERRLFYVAVSRAMNKLFLSSSSPNTKEQSMFLREANQSINLFPVQLSNLKSIDFNFEHEIKTQNESGKIGLSDILIYLECPFQFGLRRIVNIQPSVGDELGFGKGLHELIQRKFNSPETWDDRRLDKEITSHIMLPYMSLEAEIKSKQAIKERFLQLDKLNLFKRQVKTETTVEVYIEDFVVTGQIDGIEYLDDGNACVIDWKSNIHPELIGRYENQVKFYTYALRNKGVPVNSASLIDIGRSSREGKIVTKDIDISEKDISQFIERIKSSIHSILKKDFNPISSKESCSACDMYKVCNHRFALS